MQKEGPLVIGPGQEVTTPITSSNFGCKTTAAMLTCWQHLSSSPSQDLCSRPVGQDRATPVQESRGIKIKIMNGPLKVQAQTHGNVVNVYRYAEGLISVNWHWIWDRWRQRSWWSSPPSSISPAHRAGRVIGLGIWGPPKSLTGRQRRW